VVEKEHGVEIDGCILQPIAAVRRHNSDRNNITVRVVEHVSGMSLCEAQK
jgi:hypothetical protein